MPNGIAGVALFARQNPLLVPEGGADWDTRGRSRPLDRLALSRSGNAVYSQGGGQHDVNGTLTLAKYAGSTGSGGSLYVVGDLAGGRGESFLHLRGGTISVGGAIDLTAIYVDPGAGAHSYSFGASPRVTAETFWVGSAATTAFQQFGGQTQVNVAEPAVTRGGESTFFLVRQDRHCSDQGHRPGVRAPCTVHALARAGAAASGCSAGLPWRADALRP